MEKQVAAVCRADGKWIASARVWIRLFAGFFFFPDKTDAGNAEQGSDAQNGKCTARAAAAALCGLLVDLKIGAGNTVLGYDLDGMFACGKFFEIFFLKCDLGTAFGGLLTIGRDIVTVQAYTDEFVKCGI